MSEFENKVLELLKKIDEKLDKILETKSETEESAAESVEIPEEVIPTTSEPSTDITPDTIVKPSDVVARQKEKEMEKEITLREGRRTCPECGGTSFNVVEDRSKILHQMDVIKIYAKKYICKNCGYEIK